MNACDDLLKGEPIEVVAVDMPVSRRDITGRRACERLVSQAFGAKGASTHSPNVDRPGRVSTDFSRTMASKGFVLATDRGCAGPVYLEVYPHTALIRLTGAQYRLPYKEAKRRNNWPSEAPDRRRTLLIEVWHDIMSELARRTGSWDLPLDGRISLKAIEDALDAIVCAWVGLEYLSGRAEPMGDDDAAIWTPT